MQIEPKTPIADTPPAASREAWVTPAIMSYDAAVITKAANQHPGDFINSLS
jgi:hypothetical protein